MAKKRVGKFPKEFVEMTLERLKQCDNISELSKELNVHRRLLYMWRDKLDPAEPEDNPPGNSRVSTLRKEVRQLKRVLADKTLEMVFSKVHCKKERLDASGAAALARRHLRPNPGSDVVARQFEYRADVPAGPGEPGGFLRVIAGKPACRGRDGSEVRDSADCPRNIDGATDIDESRRNCGGVECL